MKPATPTELKNAAGISMPHASLILAGKKPPSRSLAIHILRTTGWRHDCIADLTDEEIDLLERLDPWKQGEAA